MKTSSVTSEKRRMTITAMVVLAVFIILSAGYTIYFNGEINKSREHYELIAHNEMAYIATTVENIMARTATLRASVQEHGDDPKFFYGAAEEIFHTVRDETGITLKNVAIAPGGVVTSVYPFSGNESLLGFNFLDTSREGNLRAKEAYDKGETIFTNPFELMQGGIGMSGRTPVITVNNGESRLWGLVSITIDFDKLLDSLKLDDFAGTGINYELSYIENDEKHVMAVKGVLDKDAVRSRANIRNLTWELSLSPRDGWISLVGVLLAIISIMGISILVGVITSMFYRLRENNEMLLKESVTDALTGCFNRKALREDALEYAGMPDISNLVCISSDVNGLKIANDTLGHQAGDELIRGAADCLRQAFGSYGNVYRTGGDEFIALIFANEEELKDLKEDLSKIIKEWHGSIVDKMSLSVGYATTKEFPDIPIINLIKISDERMYEEKREYYRTCGIDRRKR